MRRVWIIGLVAFLGLAALISTFGLGTIRASAERTEAEAWRVHTLKVLIDTARLTSSLEAMQRGQRGFLLTDDLDYLDPYVEACSRNVLFATSSGARRPTIPGSGRTSPRST